MKRFKHIKIIGMEIEPKYPGWLRDVYKDGQAVFKSNEDLQKISFDFNGIRLTMGRDMSLKELEEAYHSR